MKYSKLLLAIASIFFACISYKQSAGLNFILFSLCLQALLVWRNVSLVRSKQFIYGSLLALLTAFSVVYTNSNLSIAAFVLSHFLLNSFAHKRKQSPILNFSYAVYSFVTAVPLSISRMGSEKHDTKESTNNKGTIAAALILAFTIGVAFFVLYRSANPLFKSATDTIDLSWISFAWLFTCLLGFVLFKGLTANETVQLLSDKDLQALQPLKQTNENASGDSVLYRTAGISIFVVLNLFQLAVNVLDINHLYLSKALPAGITLADFVHQAVAGMLGLITIALLIITYLFSSWFNFDEKNKHVRFLVLLWLLQAQLMLINTAVRNWWYIQSYQLTYLRILVFVTLIICSLSLYFCWQKLQHKQSTWYLLNRLFTALLIVFFSTSFFNWDNFIAQYNINHSKKAVKLDLLYITSLAGVDNELLIPFLSQENISTEYKQAIRHKLYAKHLHDRFQQWPSWNYRAYKNEQAYFNLYK